MHHERPIPKASSTSDVAASSFEVSASICSTTWRHRFGDNSQQPSSTWVKKRVGRDSDFCFRLLYCNQNCYFAGSQLFQVGKKTMPPAFAEEMVPRRPVVRETQNSTTVIAMFVDATETHQYACVPIVPITNRNANRDIKNKEIQMLNPSARTFSKSSVFIANTFLHQLVMVCPVIFQNSLICLRQSTKTI